MSRNLPQDRGQAAFPATGLSAAHSVASSQAGGEGRYATASLFQVRRVRSLAALEFTLAQAMAVLDSHRIQRPSIPDGVTAFLPCTVLITVRQDTTTGERTGLLRFVRNDGAGCLDQALDMDCDADAARIEVVPFRGTAWRLR